jgi:hypothetical protein
MPGTANRVTLRSAAVANSRERVIGEDAARDHRRARALGRHHPAARAADLDPHVEEQLLDLTVDLVPRQLVAAVAVAGASTRIVASVPTIVRRDRIGTMPWVCIARSAGWPARSLAHTVQPSAGGNAIAVIRPSCATSS